MATSDALKWLNSLQACPPIDLSDPPPRREKGERKRYPNRPETNLCCTRRYKEKHLAEGKCVNCPAPVAEGHSRLCERHRMKQRLYVQRAYQKIKMRRVPQVGVV